MGWQNRLREMVLAGGVLFAGCSNANLAGGTGGTGGAGGMGGRGVSGGGNPSFACGNANPDPCICGRPDASSQSAADCQAEMACQAAGGVYIPYTLSDSTGLHPPHCERDGGSDGASDGNAAD